MKHTLVLISALVFLSACKKTPAEELDLISDTPEVGIVSLSPQTINQFDDLTFTISYQDGNGDLGFDDADDKSLILTDNRFPLEHEYHVAPLAPPGSDIAIQGEFIIQLQGVILKSQSNSSENATFSVKMKDRAGNWSNTATSGNITINK